MRSAFLSSDEVLFELWHFPSLRFFLLVESVGVALFGEREEQLTMNQKSGLRCAQKKRKKEVVIHSTSVLT
jgi:hypothetical protein